MEIIARTLVVLISLFAICTGLLVVFCGVCGIRDNKVESALRWGACPLIILIGIIIVLFGIFIVLL